MLLPDLNHGIQYNKAFTHLYIMNLKFEEQFGCELAPHTPWKQKTLKEKGSLIIIGLLLMVQVTNYFVSNLQRKDAGVKFSKEIINQFQKELNGKKKGTILFEYPMNDTIDIFVSENAVSLKRRNEDLNLSLCDDGIVHFDDYEKNIFFTGTEKLFLLALGELKKRNAPCIPCAPDLSLEKEE